MEKTGDSIDNHIGGRVRIRRMLIGMSQGDLAKQLDLTFQQVQKYENGTNRISAKRLLQIAEILQSPIQFFYGGLKNVWALQSYDGRPSEDESVTTFLTKAEGLALNKSFIRIRNAKLRKQVLALVSALANEQIDEQAMKQERVPRVPGRQKNLNDSER